MIGLEHIADFFGRPALDVGAEFLTEQADERQQFVAAVDLRHVEPAVDRLDARHAGVADQIADVFDAVFGQRPQLLGMLEPAAVEHALHVLRKARHHKPDIAARRIPGDRAALRAPQPTGRAGRSRAPWSAPPGRRRPRRRRHRDRTSAPASGAARPPSRRTSRRRARIQVLRPCRLVYRRSRAKCAVPPPRARLIAPHARTGNTKIAAIPRGSMLRLMLLRHAKSDWSAAGASDHERTLNAARPQRLRREWAVHGRRKADSRV